MSISISNNTYTLTGKIVNTVANKVPLLHIYAYDKDHFNDDYLGFTTSGAGGIFKLTFDRSKFGSHSFDKNPDLYFKVFHNQELVLDTSDNYIKGGRINDEELILKVNLPGVISSAMPQQQMTFLKRAAESTSDYKMTTSTELMSNYKQVEILSQEHRFLAAQTNNGHSLFFSIGTDGKFYLIQEKEGTKTGWQKEDLSKKISGGSAVAKTFHIAQNHESGHIDIGLVLTASDGTDHLFLSLGNSNASLDWTTSISWTEIADDRATPSSSKLNIRSIYLSEASTRAEYIVVDVSNPNGYFDRYFIDQSSSPQFKPHPLPTNMDAAAMLDTQIGRKMDGEKIAPVDGIYTMGINNIALELIYTPIFNYFDPDKVPNSASLDVGDTKLSTTNAAFSVCKAISGKKNVTDVFIAGGGDLYYFAAENQSHLAKPVRILGNELLTEVKSLHASISSSKVVVWGRNSADQIFYTSCALSQMMDSTKWSIPLPIQTGVSAVSPYIDNRDGSLTFFSNLGNSRLTKGVQNPISTLWKFSNIELPTPDDVKATKALSYTHSLHVTDANNKPAAGIEVTITAQSRTNVYINHLYYSLGTNPIPVKTDANGGITIVEWVEDLKGTDFKFHLGNISSDVLIQPEHSPLKKMKGLNSNDALSAAVITNKDGSTRPLLPTTGVSDADKKVLVQSIGNLSAVYDSLNTGETTMMAAMAVAPQASGLEYIAVLAGDLFKFLEHAIEYEVKLIKKAGEKIWHFVVTVAGKVYGFIIDTVKKIAGGFEAIWRRIVKGIEGLIEYLKFLFDWEDMVRTKKVMKQVILLYFQNMEEELQSAREFFDQDVTKVKEFITNWASEAGKLLDLGNSDHSMNATLAKTDHSSDGHSAPARMLQHHFAGNVGRSTSSIHSPNSVNADPTWTGLADMSDFFTKEKATMDELINHVKMLFIGNDHALLNPDFSEVLKKIAADIVKGAIDLLQLGVDKLLDFLTLLIKEIMSCLDTPIQIPIVSDILEDLFGIQMPSILDILCLIGAVPATIIYKGTRGKAPYPKDDEFLEKITQANTFADLKVALGSPNAEKILLKDDAKSALYETGHIIAGISTMINGVLTEMDEAEDGSTNTVFQTPLKITKVVSTVTHKIADLFIMPAPLKTDAIKQYSKIVTGINATQSLCFLVAPKAVAKIKGLTESGDIESSNAAVHVVSKGFDALLALAGLLPPVFHVFEIITDVKHASIDGVLATMDATGDVTKKISTIIGFAALTDQEPLSKAALMAVQGGFIEITGGLQLAAAGEEAARQEIK